MHYVDVVSSWTSSGKCRTVSRGNAMERAESCPLLARGEGREWKRSKHGQIETGACLSLAHTNRSGTGSVSCSPVSFSPSSSGRRSLSLRYRPPLNLHAPIDHSTATLNPPVFPSSSAPITMVDSSWAQQQHQPRDSRGWVAHDSDRSRRSGSTNWLARLLGASNELPAYADEKPLGGGEFAQRMKGLKRNVMRRLPSMDWSQQRAHRLTAQSPSSLSTPSTQTVRFVLLCCLWYTTSALSSNTGKSIMTTFRYPVTLTFIQFGFVAAYCLLFMSPFVRFSKLRRPNKVILQSTFPMGVFQVGGHIFSSMAISRIHVSTVHTIKVSLSCSAPHSPISSPSPGALAPVHSCSICPPLQRQLLGEDLCLAPAADTRCHAGV